MADGPTNDQNQSVERSPHDPRGTIATIEVDSDKVKEVVIRLYSQGFQRAQISRMLVDYLVPHKRHRPLEQRLSQARSKLRNWEASPVFRDKIYQASVVKLDLAMPEILGGVAKKAKKGRIDAAKLALELTGRHNPKGDLAPAQIVLNINGVPRPASNNEDIIEGEIRALES